MKYWLKNRLHIHDGSSRRPIVVFGSPRGGTTWIAELIAHLGNSWVVHEPFNVRSTFVQNELSVSSFSELYEPSNLLGIERYFKKILDGNYAQLKVWPWEKGYSPKTDHIVVKLNQGLLNKMNWFCQRFSVSVIHLVRHPIAVALSREEFPLLQDFDRCKLRDEFSVEELACADKIIASGSKLEKGVLMWCLHHGPALRAHPRNALFLSYELCVTQPTLAFSELLAYLGMPHRLNRILELSRKPSSVIYKSDKYTKSAVTEKYDTYNIISKWRRIVTQAEEEDLLSIIGLFGLGAHVHGQDRPLSPCDCRSI